MEKRYEITEKQLAFLEDYLKRKKRFSNPEDLYELMDHLISDFEATTKNGNLSQYLADNSSFIFKFSGSSKNQEDAIHWRYQRELWQIFFSLFYKVKYLVFTIICFVFLYTIFIEFNFSDKFVGLTFLTLIIFPSILSFYWTYHKNKKVRKLISFQSLFNIMGLPQMFLYAFIMIDDFLEANRLLFFIYTFIAVILHFSGVLLIFSKRKEILKKHKHLLN